jgi:hypothetical protein
VALAQVWNVSQSLVDSRFAETALAIAADRGASAQARVFALGGLINMAQQGRVWAGYGSLTGGFADESTGEVRGGCGRARVADDGRLRGGHCRVTSRRASARSATRSGATPPSRST